MAIRWRVCMPAKAPGGGAWVKLCNRQRRVAGRARERETLVVVHRGVLLLVERSRRSIYSILIKLCKALQYDRGPTGAEPRPGGESAARNLES